jgi:hypothetical protein
VVVDGEAVAVTDGAVLSRLATTRWHKWDGCWHYRVRDDRFFNTGGGRDAVIFAVAPANVLEFGKGPFTHTTHRF